MNMTEEAFFAQSVLHWQRRVSGFIEMHSGGEAADEPFTADEFADLEERCRPLLN
jgi:hypothetical protein